MTNLLGRLRGAERSITTLEDYAAALSSFGFQGNTYGLGMANGVQQTLKGSPVETIPHNFSGYSQAYKSNGIVFACMLSRMQVFSATRFQFQRFNKGRPSEMFGLPSLRLVEEPWLGGTTQDLLTRMIQDADLAGNSYWVKDEGELVRLRPDWVTIVLARNQSTGTFVKQAYLFDEDGPGTNRDARIFWPEDVAHFAPIPDPMASFRGMSWLTPVIRETQTDHQMNTHKQKFFENAATPNMVVSLDSTITPEKFERFKAVMAKEHRGPENAYKPMYVGGGADVTVVGADFKQIDLKAVQGHGETRIAAAAGVPPIIVGLSEGLEAATYSNYGQARRRFADGTIHPLWQNAAGTLQRLLPAPAGARLWYDSRDVPFLREDEKDAAGIQNLEAQTIRQLVDAGYTAESVVAAVGASDFGLLKHSGLFSVQLQPPGIQAAPPTPKEAP